MVDLGAYDEPVPFDDDTADALKAAASGLAQTLRDQAGARQGWADTALTEFKGHYADVFRSNAQATHDDCTNIASALDALATDVQTMKQAAADERTRRQKAKKWAEDQKNDFWLVHDIKKVAGKNKPPAGPPADPVINAEAPTVSTWQQPAPGGGGGTSSARPDDLRSFATNSAGANDTVATGKGTLEGAITDFQEKCSWCTIDASGITGALATFTSNNDNDVTWANSVAAAFETAGASGEVCTVSDAAIDASLQAAGARQERQPINVTAPSILGDPQTSGYADDPVNTTTGNFVEPETDLAFGGASSSLVFERTYNSLSSSVGGFGPGWASTADQKLRFSDEGATWVQATGRHVSFGRLGGGWDRATGASYWLHRTDTTAVSSTNATGALTSDTAASTGDTSTPDKTDGVDTPASNVRATGTPAGDSDAPADTSTPADGTGLPAGGYVISDNQGGRWAFNPAGRLSWTCCGPGTRVDYQWNPDGTLASLTHEWGQRITLEWDNTTQNTTAHDNDTGRDGHGDNTTTGASRDTGTTEASSESAEAGGNAAAGRDADAARDDRDTVAGGNAASQNSEADAASQNAGADKNTAAGQGPRADHQPRISALAASDGRRIEFAYNQAGRLVEAAGPGGPRHYQWNQQGLICSVVDPDGVVEVANEYNKTGQVVSQRSPVRPHLLLHVPARRYHPGR